jgi:signal transduction histidine kinase
VALSGPLRAALHAAAPEFAARGAALADLPSEADGVVVWGDPGALEQLFLNLLLNAAQALGPGGSAAVELREEERQVVVTVGDDGPGIPPDLLERVFEPFVSTKPAGTGLGLAVARRIALAHRGEIRMESTPGTGTTVHVRLPRRSGEPLPTPGPPR